MIERIVLFKLVEPETRQAAAEQARAQLAALPGLKSMTVGVPSDPASLRSWDLSVILRFADQPATDAALASPAFEGFMEETMEDRYEVVKAWSFESP